MIPVIGISGAWSVETWGDSSPEKGYIYAGTPYAAVIYENGAAPVILAPPPRGLSGEKLRVFCGAVLDRLDGLLLSGGGDARRYAREALPGLREQQPFRYRFEQQLIREAWKRKIPAVGICRGCQMIAESLGGGMRRETVPDHMQQEFLDKCHDIFIQEGTALRDLCGSGRWKVNSFHRQVIEAVPPGFTVSARDAGGVIEAMEAADGVFWHGLQFHPELLPDDPCSRAIFQKFIKASSAYRKQRHG